MPAQRRTRAVAAAAVLLTTASIAGACSSSTPGEQEEGGEQVVRFWHAYAGERETWLKDVAAKYNKQTDGVTIKPESKGSYDELFDAVLLAAKNKTAPEIAQVVVTYVASARESGAYKSITEVDTDGKINPDDYLAPVIGQLTVDDELTSVPFAHSGPMLFYDKKLFAKAGLDPEQPPRTFEDILSACETIVDKKKVAPTCIGIPWDPWFLENFMAEQGAPLLDNGNGRDDRATAGELDSDEAIKAATFWQTLKEKGYYRHSKEAYVYERQLLTQKDAAMTLSSTADAGFYQAALKEAGRELGAGYFPAPSGIEPAGTTLGGGSLWITAGHSEEREQASLDFLKWLTSPEMAAEWHKATGYFPVNRAAETRLADEGWFKQNPAFRVALDQVGDTVEGPATHGPLHGAMPEVNEASLTALEEIVLGGADPADALAKSNADATAAIEKYNDLYGG